MTQELATIKNQEISIWECPTQLQEIKQIYAAKATEFEFKMLVQLGRATGLNPFLREIWLVKYGDSAAQIFIGRDGYRKSAQAYPNYDYHHVEAVYSNDHLQYHVIKGEVDHVQDFKNRGNLVGAYCIVKRKNASRPVYVFVDLKEYNTGKSLWASKPATMIKKVAEAQCLRMAFQNVYGGSYSDAEIDITPVTQDTLDTQAHHKQFEGKPLSQSYVMPKELLEIHLQSLRNAADMDLLKALYNNAKAEAKGDKAANNAIAETTKARKAELLQQEEVVTAEVVDAPILTKEEIEAHTKSREEFMEGYNK